MPIRGKLKNFLYKKENCEHSQNSQWLGDEKDLLVIKLHISFNQNFN